MIGWILCGLLLLSPFCVADSLSEYADLPQSAAVLLFACIAALAWAIRSMRAGSFPLPVGTISLELSAFIAWSFLSLLWAGNRYLALCDAAYYLACGVVFFLVATGPAGRNGIRRLLTFLFIAWAGCALYGIGQQMFGLDWIDQSAPPSSLFANRNMAAQYVCMVLPLALVTILLPGRPPGRTAVYIAALLGILYILFTGSRAALLSTLTIFSIIFAGFPLISARHSQHSRSRRAVFIALLAGLIVLPLLAAPAITGKSAFKQNFAPLASIGAELRARRQVPTSPQVRIALWRNGLEIARDNLLLGVGGGNFEVIYPRYNRAVVADKLFGFDRKARFVHNEFLQVMIDYGGIGLFFYLVFLVSLLTSAWRIVRRNNSYTEQLIGLGAGGVVVAYLVLSLFSFPLHRSMPPLLLALTGGILASLLRTAPGRESRRMMPLPRGAGVLLLGTVTVTVCLALAGGWAVVRGDYHFQRARSAEIAGDFKSAWKEGVLCGEVCRGRVDGFAIAGASAIRLGDHDEAARLLSRVLESRPWHTNSLLNLGVAWTKLGQPARGARHTAAVLVMQPGNRLAHSNLGYQYLRAKDYDRAAGHLTTAIESGADDPRNRFYLGFVLYHLKRYNESAAAFEKALELDPNYGPAHRSLAALYTEVLVDPEKSEAHARRYEELEKNPLLTDLFREELEKLSPGELGDDRF